MKVFDVCKEMEGLTASTHSTQFCLDWLKMVDGKELKSLLLSFLPKMCTFYPIPTFLLHEFVDELLPFLVWP